MIDKELINKLRNNEDINLSEIINNNIYHDGDDNACINWNKLGLDILNFYQSKKELKLYNVQFIIIEKYSRLINKFVYAYDETQAKEFVFKDYRNFEFDKCNVYCQEVDIKEGMIFSS